MCAGIRFAEINSDRLDGRKQRQALQDGVKCSADMASKAVIIGGSQVSGKLEGETAILEEAEKLVALNMPRL